MGGFSFGGFDSPEDDDALRASRIARPTQSSAIPPVTLRGVGSPSGSTSELESEGLASHVAPRPIAAPSPLESRTTADQGELSRLQSSGSGVSQIAKAHPVAGGILRGLGTAGSIIGAADPLTHRILGSVPGTEEHHTQLINQQRGRIGEDLGEQKEEAATAETGARTDQAQAAAEKDRADATAKAHPAPKEGLTPEETTIHDLMTGENGQPRVDPQTQQPYTYLGAYQAVKQAGQDVKPAPKQNDFEQFYTDWLKDNNFPDTAHNRLMARSKFAAAGQAPQHDPRQMVIGPDGKVIELHPGDTVPQGSKTVAGDLTNKPTPDEQRRADLSENLNENLGTLEEIVTRRPDLFGPVAGRMTGLKGMIGSDDPDIGTLETIKHQIGMAQISAHGMRSAQGVGAAAESILNSFKNGPEAVKASINAARNSVKTFTGDVNKTQNAGAQNPGQGGGELKPPKEADQGMKWQHRTTNGKTEWRQVPAQ